MFVSALSCCLPKLAQITSLSYAKVLQLAYHYRKRGKNPADIYPAMALSVPASIFLSTSNIKMSKFLDKLSTILFYIRLY